ncbi:MAG: hypothetical protein P1V35_12860 [Planctomycetota bacterium]|nr:hypothetical protein [Planctomycetota bacterium]
MNLISTVLIVIALYAILVAIRTGFSEVIKALQAIHDKLDDPASR